MHSKPKDGKSTLVRQLAVAVSQGKPFLGRETVQGLVMYIALEEKPSEISKHFALLGANDEDPIVTLTDFRGSSLAEMRDAIVASKPVLVIVDTLAKFLRLPKMNDYGPVNDAVRWIHDVARDTGAHLLAVSHSKKGAAEDSIDNLLGSTAFAAAVDTLIALGRLKGNRTITTIQRYGDKLEETSLHFDPVSRSMSLMTSTKADAEEEKRQSSELLSRSIVEFVTANPGCRNSDIARNVTGKDVSIWAALQKLSEEVLRKEGTGRSGDPFLYYADVPIEA